MSDEPVKKGADDPSPGKKDEKSSNDSIRGKMPFTGHLGELRRHIMVAVGTITVLFLISFNFSEDIFRFLLIPMRADLKFLMVYPFITLVDRGSALSELIFLAPAEAFWVHLKISLISALLISLPILFHEFWKFVSPGLLSREKKYALPFIATSSGLFFFGAAFCFVVVLPFAMKFLLTYKTALLTPMISVEKYMDFTLKFILAFGVVFELPLILVILTRIGIVTPATLAKNRKYAILLAFVTAAVLTPTPDAFNQTLMAVPIILLYEGGVIASRILVRRKKGHDDKGEKPKGDSS